MLPLAKSMSHWAAPGAPARTNIASIPFTMWQEPFTYFSFRFYRGGKGESLINRTLEYEGKIR